MNCLLVPRRARIRAKCSTVTLDPPPTPDRKTSLLSRLANPPPPNTTTGIFAANLCDVWIDVIGPKLHAPDVISLSMVCWASRHISFRVKTSNGFVDVCDETDDLVSLKQVLAKWPLLKIRTKFDKFSLSDKQLRNNLDVIGKVQSLTLQRCMMMRFDFVDLSKMEELVLTGTTLGPIACISLSECTLFSSSLRSLTLHENRCWVSEGVRVLCESLISINELNISGNYIGRDGCSLVRDSLKNNSTLQHLRLCRTSIGPEGAIPLAEMLTVNKTLLTFHVPKNGLANEGCAAICEAIETHPSLTSLDFSDNGISGIGYKSICRVAQTAPALTHLNVSDNQTMTNGMSKELCDAVDRRSAPSHFHIQAEGVCGEDIRWI